MVAVGECGGGVVADVVGVVVGEQCVAGLSLCFVCGDDVHRWWFSPAIGVVVVVMLPGGCDRFYLFAPIWRPCSAGELFA